MVKRVFDPIHKKQVQQLENVVQTIVAVRHSNIYMHVVDACL